MIKKYISPGSKVEMRSLQEITLPDGTEGKKTYTTSVYDILNDGRIEFVMPMEKTKLILLPIGTEYDVFFFAGLNMYKATVRIADRRKDKSTYILAAEFVSSLVKYQRREYYRFNCVIDMMAKQLTQEEIEAYSNGAIDLVSDIGMAKGIIVDISGGGMRFVSKSQYIEEGIICTEFSLNIDGRERNFFLAAKVIYSREIDNRPNEYESRVKFVYIESATREEIIKYIFKEERKNRKNGRGR